MGLRTSARVLALFLAGAPLTSEGAPIAPTLQEPELEMSMRRRIEVHAADRGALRRRYAAPMSVRRLDRLERFERERLEQLEAVDFDALDVDERIDWILLDNEIARELDELGTERRRLDELAPLLGPSAPLVALLEAREDVEPLDPDPTAALLARTAEELDAHTERVRDGEFDATSTVVASRATRELGRLRRALDGWYRFRSDYDPTFDWWIEAPHVQVVESLEGLRRRIESQLIDGDGDVDATLIADPLGRDALVRAIDAEFLPYSPEELLAIAEAELARCDAMMLEASRELGFGDDWRAAQEHVRGLHVAPGEQPQLVADMVREAIDFVVDRDLVTVPELARETWRMTMLSPARQRTSPYFLGGEEIQVAFPTASMSDEDKRATLAGNNVHFSRAVVHHEVIPGHHLQQFVRARHRPYRGLFSTPFWVEGWALYWEFRLWEMDFPRGPEDRIGMLFWRKHRCARILFSLGLHLGTLTGEEAVDLLVERVGHRRRNAEAEVRRSVGGLYPPLYQAAYMLGGLQIRALHRELVERGDWTERGFHDAVLHQNSIPIELLRASLKGQALERDFASSWRFAD